MYQRQIAYKPPKISNKGSQAAIYVTTKPQKFLALERNLKSANSSQKIL
jgi:hypothetical protein